MKSVAGASSAPLSRRAVLRGLAGGLAAALAVACGSNAGGDTTARPIQSQAIAGKVLWEIRTEPTYAELAKQALPIFKQTHPQIEVEFTPKPPSW